MKRCTITLTKSQGNEKMLDRSAHSTQSTDYRYCTHCVCKCILVVVFTYAGPKMNEFNDFKIQTQRSNLLLVGERSETLEHLLFSISNAFFAAVRTQIGFCKIFTSQFIWRSDTSLSKMALTKQHTTAAAAVSIRIDGDVCVCVDFEI